MHNASVFNMNASVRNLPTNELLLTERIFADDPTSSMKRRNALLIKANPTDYSKMQKYMDEELKAEKEKEKLGKKDMEDIYNKYTVSAYIVNK